MAYTQTIAQRNYRFADLKEVLAKASPEVVIVGTPPHTHAEYCLRALEADGRPVGDLGRGHKQGTQHDEVGPLLRLNRLFECVALFPSTVFNAISKSLHIRIIEVVVSQCFCHWNMS